MNRFLARFQNVAPGIRLRPLMLALVAALALPIFGFSALFASAQQSTPSAGASACASGTPTAATPAATTATGTPSAGLCVSIDSYDIYYKPNLVTIPANQDVTIELPNKGASAHSFIISDHNNANVKNLNIDVEMQPGETKSVTVNAPAGNYYFYCDIPGHEQAGMFGYLQVKDGAQISTETATVTPPASS